MRSYPQATPAPRPPSAQRVYSLGDEEEEEQGGSAVDSAERGAWAAELGLLALHASVLLPTQVRERVLLWGCVLPLVGW